MGYLDFFSIFIIMSIEKEGAENKVLVFPVYLQFSIFRLNHDALLSKPKVKTKKGNLKILKLFKIKKYFQININSSWCKIPLNKKASNLISNKRPYNILRGFFLTWQQQLGTFWCLINNFLAPLQLVHVLPTYGSPLHCWCCLFVWVGRPRWTIKAEWILLDCAQTTYIDNL